jgi:dienelactone hydrolase
MRWTLVGLVGFVLWAQSAQGSETALEQLIAPWPDPVSDSVIDILEVRFPSRSPFVPEDSGLGGERDPPVTAIGTLFLPKGAGRTPGVVLLHGSGGVLYARELTYGRQFAAMGIAALVVDAFAARRELAIGFFDRIVNITETMMLADAFAALDYLVAHGNVDPARVALIGFSYGAMASMYAAHTLMVEKLAAKGHRFAAHAAFYPPCLARFADPATTGAPVLILRGGRDAIADPEKCDEIAADLRRGGSPVEHIVYPEAAHQWDGGFGGPRRIGRDLRQCSLIVNKDGSIDDRRTFLPMSGPFLRRLILMSCAGTDPYEIARDDSVRARSNADLGRLLAAAFR